MYKRQVYIIADSRQLNERDQNVLLKIVEEGPPYAAFIFCTDSPAALLETDVYKRQIHGWREKSNAGIAGMPL